MYHSFFQPLMDTWVDSVSWLLSNPAVNMEVQLSEILISFPLDTYAEMGFLDHMTVLFLIF